MLKINFSESETRQQRGTDKARTNAKARKPQCKQASTATTLGQRIAALFKRGDTQRDCNPVSGDILIL